MMTPNQILGHISGGKVLDVATGTGGFIHFLIDGLNDFDAITGIDAADRGEAAFAEAFKDKPNVRFVRMAAEHLDFPEAAFDTVCISNSLHHLSNLPRVLAEMKRVLKPDGHFIISEMYRDGQTEEQLTHVLLHHWWAAVDVAQGVTHYETYTREQIVSIIEELNLRQLVLHDFCDLSGDPHDPETIKELDGTIDRYIERVKELPAEVALRQRGEQLRQRIRTVGFQSATTLIAVGRGLVLARV